MSGILSVLKPYKAGLAKFAALICLLTLPAASAFAQEVLIRNDNFSTELFLRIEPSIINIVNHDNSSSIVNIRLNSAIKPFSQALNDPFIKSINGSGALITVTFTDTADFAVFSDPEGLRFLGTRPRELENILLSYGVGAPILRRENIFTENAVLEAQLKHSDTQLANNDIYGAINTLNNLLATTRNSFYIQEALFRLGNAYMELAKYDPSAYIDAYTTFDRFIREFPRSNRLMQARMLTAEAKEQSGAIIDAANANMDIFRTASDSETKRRALLRVAELYTSIGQYDSAIEAYEEYLRTFRTDTERVKTLLGSLYIERGLKDKAYDIFVNVPISVLTDTLTNEEMLSLSKIFNERNNADKALALLSHITEGDSPEALDAWVNIASIKRQQGDKDAYSAALENIMELGQGTQYGYDAMVEFAELHYANETADEWESFLAPVFAVEDHNNLRSRARMVIIKRLQLESDPFRLIRAIDHYLETYPEPEINAALLKIKEDTLFNTAVEYHTAKNYPQALAIYRQLLEQFPESPRVPAVKQYIDDIYYDMAAQAYNNGNYSDAIRAVEDWMLNNPPDLQERWMLLWEDAVFQFIMQNIGVLDPRTIRYKAREYLAFMPQGRYIPEIRQVLEQNFQYQYDAAFRSGNYAEVVELYDENKPWLDIWPDQSINNNAKITATQSLIRLGLRERAKELFTTITPSMSSDYAEAGFTLCQRDMIFNVNRLSRDEFLKIVDEAERCGDPDYTLDLISRYTVDRRTALEAQNRVTKNISDERRRMESLNSMFQELVNNPASRFDGYEEVFLEVGLLAYRKNDFAGAILPLQRYIDNAANDSDMKAEALYYLGKSLLAINERDRGLGYFRQIVTTMPDSVFRNMAQSELEDDAWINSNR